MSDCICNIQEIEVEQLYGVIGVKELPEEYWFTYEEVDWNE